MSDENDKKVLAIYADEELVKALDAAAKDNSRTRSGQAVHYIRMALLEEGKL